MLRLFDLLLSLFGLLLLWPLIFILLLVGVFDTGSPLFCQTRVGLNQKPFTLFKLRTMRVGTASVASHLASANSITPFGHFLRRTKLDELPQLWNVLLGQMSFVGPRPCLFNQVELIAVREQLGVFQARPGITGLGQINNVDMSEPQQLAELDARMLRNLTVASYFGYILKTVTGKGRGDAIRS